MQRLLVFAVGLALSADIVVRVEGDGRKHPIDPEGTYQAFVAQAKIMLKSKVDSNDRCSYTIHKLKVYAPKRHKVNHKSCTATVKFNEGRNGYSRGTISKGPACEKPKPKAGCLGALFGSG